MAKNDIINPTTERVDNMGDYQYKPNKRKQDYDVQYSKEHYDAINLKLPKGYKDTIKAKAQESNQTMTEWLKDLIDKELNIGTDHNI